MANSKSKPSTDFPAALVDRLGRHVGAGQRLCVALSGGVDSVALLHATAGVAKALSVRSLSALHVHHGLSPHADEWVAFCRELCESLGVALDVRRVEVKPEGEGIEAAARKARYAELETFDGDWILLGHHRDDQAETVLLNLLRGTGVHGAAGMTERRGRFLRPLLAVTRAEIAAYARQNGLSWINDESNADSRYSRNFLRHRVMPLLEQSFPQAAHSLARAAHAFGEAAALLDHFAAEDIGSARRLKVSQLRALPAERGANLLAFYLRRHGLQIPGSAMLREMLRQLTTADCDSMVRFVVGAHEVRRFRDQVFVEALPEPAAPRVWSGESTIPWGSYRIQLRPVIGNGVAASVKELAPLCFSVRHGGDALQLNPVGPRRQLKDLLREAGIPPWRRKTLPVLYSRDDPVWVAGIGIAAKYRCKPGVEGFLIEFDGVTW